MSRDKKDVAELRALLRVPDEDLTLQGELYLLELLEKVAEQTRESLREAVEGQ